jgi:acetyl esterase/lipase
MRTSTVEFSPGLYLDVTRPDGATRLPAIIWLHGGAWRMGDRTWLPDFWDDFALSGFVMVSIDYTLSGDAPFPRNLHDVRTAIRWVRAHADHYGVIPDAVGLWGSSAGGHLASLVALTGGDATVQAVVDGYGPADLLAPDQDVPPTVGLLGGSPREFPDRARAASPALHDASQAPPFLILHGTGDDLVPASQSIALYDSLARAGRDATLYLIDGFGHGFLNPAGGDELGAGPRLDSGRLAAEPGAAASIRTTGSAAELPTSASFELIRQFFHDRLDDH